MPLWRGCAVGVGLDQQQRHVAVQAVGDPGLRAVDDVVVAVELGDGADRLQVGAGVRLGEAEAAAHLAGRHPRQVLALLLFGAVALDRRSGDQVRVEDARRRHPDRCDLDDDLRVGPGRQARGRRTPRQSWRRTGRAPSSARRCRAGIRRPRSYLSRDGPQFLLDPGLDRVDEFLLVVDLRPCSRVILSSCGLGGVFRVQ